MHVWTNISLDHSAHVPPAGIAILLGRISVNISLRITLGENTRNLFGYTSIKLAGYLTLNYPKDLCAAVLYSVCHFRIEIDLLLELLFIQNTGRKLWIEVNEVVDKSDSKSLTNPEEYKNKAAKHKTTCMHCTPLSMFDPSTNDPTTLPIPPNPTHSVCIGLH